MGYYTGCPQRTCRDNGYRRHSDIVFLGWGHWITSNVNVYLQAQDIRGTGDHHHPRYRSCGTQWQGGRFLT